MSDIFPPGRWRARWIWAPGRVEGRHSVALRRVASLDHVSSMVLARLSAVSRYTLYINGAEVSRGPVRANPRRQPYDLVDLMPHLRTGDNVIGVIAWRYDGPTAWWLPPPPANDLQYGAFVFEARLGEGWLVSDEAWAVTILDGWSATPPAGIGGRGTEIIDLRSLPTGWNIPDGPDPGWEAAKTRRGAGWADTSGPFPPSYPGGPLGDHPIPYLTGDPVEADGQRVIAGTVVVNAEIPAGETVAAAVSELVASGSVEARDMATSVAFIGDGTRRLAESFDLYGGRGISVDAPDGSVVHSVRIRERLCPVEGEAFFECSDPRLNAIYRIGCQTVSLCSMDSYIDCPTREQRVWTGDSVVHQMVDLTTNTDWRLARWHPALTAFPRPDGMLPMAVAGEIEHLDRMIIPDWALHWVHSVHNLYRYSEIATRLPACCPSPKGSCAGSGPS